MVLPVWILLFSFIMLCTLFVHSLPDSCPPNTYGSACQFTCNRGYPRFGDYQSDGKFVEGGSYYGCYCDAGYEGLRCNMLGSLNYSIDYAPSGDPCCNRGSWRQRNITGRTEYGAGICNCLSGFYGHHCQFSCGYGVPIGNSSGTFTCSCITGYTGHRCDVHELSGQIGINFSDATGTDCTEMKILPSFSTMTSDTSTFAETLAENVEKNGENDDFSPNKTNAIIGVTASLSCAFTIVAIVAVVGLFFYRKMQLECKPPSNNAGTTIYYDAATYKTIPPTSAPHLEEHAIENITYDDIYEEPYGQAPAQPLTQL